MTMWGGRFEGSLSEAVWRFTTDESDRRLLQVDIEGSIAHVEMLGSTSVIEAQEAQTLAKGLRTILAEAEADEFAFETTD